MNLLIIEFRAEIGFANTQEILRFPDLFVGRRAEAEEAAEIVERIRLDEEIHVTSLRLYLGELRTRRSAHCRRRHHLRCHGHRPILAGSGPMGDDRAAPHRGRNPVSGAAAGHPRASRWRADTR
jgi:hypothetical protein